MIINRLSPCFLRAAGTAIVATFLLAAGAAPRHAPRSDAVRMAQDELPDSETPPAAPRAPAAPVVHASNPAIVDGFLALAYGADPASGIPARETTARFSGDMRGFVTGSEADRRYVARTMGWLQHLTRLPMAVTTGDAPNLFVAVTDRPAEAFGGSLRQLLQLALNGDEEAVSGFLAKTVAIQPCWVLPVWTDGSRTLIKAAVIGIDARIGRAAIDRCIERKIAASVGLMGSEDALPRSVFNPSSGATRYSFEDQLMIRLLYDPGLAVGLNEPDARTRALDAIRRLRPR